MAAHRFSRKRPWMPMVTGIVVAGDGRGRSLGFPTANLDVEGDIRRIVGTGVYAATAFWEGAEMEYPAVINVGVRPTFSSGQLAVEAHIIEFTGDLYGKTLRIRTVEKLREEQRFPSLDTLVEQLEKDVERAREVIQSTENGGRLLSITAERSRELTAKYGRNETDSGAVAVQIAILSERIGKLTTHLQAHRQDFATRRGLLQLIGRRRRLQRYYQKKNPEGYAQLIQDLQLRR